MLSQLLIYGALALVIASFTLFLGRALIKSVTGFEFSTNEAKLFAYGITGLLTIVTIGSVIRTSGVTVHMALLVLIIAFLLVNKHRIRFAIRKENFTLNRSGFKTFRQIEVLILGLVALSAVQFFSFSSGELMIPERDILYYGSLSEALWNTGQENNFFYGSEITKSLEGLAPYHYFIEWFNALIYGIFGTNPTLSFLLITTPTFALVVVFGFAAIAKKIRPGLQFNTAIMLGVCGLLFQAHLPWDPADNQYLKHVENLGYFPYEHSMNLKALPVYIGLLWSVNLFLSGKMISGIIALTLLPIVNISTGPAVALSIPILVAGLLLFKQIKFSQALVALLACFAVGVSVALIYSGFGNWISSNFLDDQIASFSPYIDESYIADIYYLLKWIPIETFALFSMPILTSIILKIWLKHKSIPGLKPFLFVAACIWLSGLLAWTVLRLMGPDSYQFLVLAGTAALNIIVWSFIASAMGRSGKKSLVAVTVVFAVIASYSLWNSLNSSRLPVRQYSATFLQEAKILNAKLGNPVKVVSFADSTYNKTVSNRDPFMTSMLCGAYWYMIEGEDKIHNLDAMQIPISDAVGRFHEMRILSLAPINVTRRNGDLINSIGWNQVDFIDETGARIYLYEPGVTIEPEVLNRIEYTITDPLSGETIAVLSEKQE